MTMPTKPKKTTPPPEALERSRRLGLWFEDWAAQQRANGVTLDDEALAESAGEDFHRRAREIMGLPPL